MMHSHAWPPDNRRSGPHGASPFGGLPNHAMIQHITTLAAMCEDNTAILRKDTDPSALAAASGRAPLSFRNFVRQHRPAFGAVAATA